MEEEKKIPVIEQSKSTEIDYNKINGYINERVDNEVGKFMKTFLENNKINNQPENTISEQEIIDKELSEWKI